MSDKMLATNLLGRTVRKGDRKDLWFVRQEGDVFIDQATTATIVVVTSSTDVLSLWAQADDGEAKGEIKHFCSWSVIVEAVK